MDYNIMRLKFSLYVFLLASILFIQCSVSNKSIKRKEYDIVGEYWNKESHYSIKIDLSKDSSFFQLVKPEFRRYEYRGVWTLKGDTLILKCNNLNKNNEYFFRNKWLLRGYPVELGSLNNSKYFLKRDSVNSTRLREYRGQ